MRPVGDCPQAESPQGASEVEFHRLLETFPVAVYTCNAQGLITCFNKRAVALWGRKPKLNDAEDRFCGSFRLYSPDGSPVSREQCWAALALRQGKECHEQEIVVERPDGTRRTVLASTNPNHDAAGKVSGATNVLVDITERKAAEQALRERTDQLELAIEAARQDICLHDTTTNRIESPKIQPAVNGGSSDQTAEGLRGTCAGMHPEDRRIVCDMTGRKTVEDMIRASEARLQGILDNTSAVIYLKDWCGRFLVINKRFEELFHVSQQEVAGKTDHAIFSADAAARFAANDEQVRQAGRSLEFEETAPHDDGPHTYISVKFPIYDHAGQGYAVGGISTDITDRKKASETLEAEREFLQHTIELQDQERQLITYEIHDGLVQYATGALMQLEALRDQVESPSIAERIENVVGILRETVAEGRRIINGIRTPLLDASGVIPAIEQMIAEADWGNVQVEFVKENDLGRMAANIEEAIFRITQEVLTNARRHSQSKKVRVELNRRGDRIHLKINDWGIGFDTRRSSKGVHGIKGMTERARIVGGRCTIQSAPGKGTCVNVEFPYAPRT